MVEAPHELIEAFCRALRNKCSERVCTSEIRHEHLPAPHCAGDLPAGRGAVYVFSLSGSTVAAAGPHRALKVGRAGPNSNARFRYQHYEGGSAGSTLAGAIGNNALLHDFLGFDSSAPDIGQWIRERTDRDHFFVDRSRHTLLPLLELYLKARLGPMFEGSMSKKV